MRILIISKCPTHPTNAGNRWWILSQAEMFMSLGHDVYFLYISDKTQKHILKVLSNRKNIGAIDIIYFLSVNGKKLR